MAEPTKGSSASFSAPPPGQTPAFAAGWWEETALALDARLTETRMALAALLEHAERIQEHVPKSEAWYAVRDCARVVLAGEHVA